MITPYRRSNPVAIANDVNAVDITANARTPGTNSSIGRWERPRWILLGRLDAADEHDHRDHDRKEQLLAVPQHQLRLDRGLREHLPGQRSRSRVAA